MPGQRTTAQLLEIWRSAERAAEAARRAAEASVIAAQAAEAAAESARRVAIDAGVSSAAATEVAADAKSAYGDRQRDPDDGTPATGRTPSSRSSA